MDALLQRAIATLADERRANLVLLLREAYDVGFADAMHVAETWQDGVALTPAAIRTMQWRAIERMMGRDPYRSKNGHE